MGKHHRGVGSHSLRFCESDPEVTLAATVPSRAVDLRFIVRSYSLVHAIHAPQARSTRAEEAVICGLPLSFELLSDWFPQ
jgi:hypothetical protein